MRKLLIPLLLASAIAPVAAHAESGAAWGGHRPQEERGNRDNSSDDRPQRAERVQRVERNERIERPVRVERTDRSDRQVQRVERPVIQQNSVRTAQPVQRVERRDRSLAEGFQQVARQQANRRDRDRDRVRDRDHDWNNDRWRDRDRNDNDWRDRNGSHRRWSGDWRRDSRYNWSSYRNRYGSIFRLGRYYDPYGYNYRRFSIGFTLSPSYYSPSFWLNDPWQYRLPPAYGPYRWVRYYEDALLVNIYTGEVVDVINNFFW